MPPITPEQLAEASTRLDKLTQKLEKTILDDICRRIAKAGTITDTAEWQMMRLKEMGYANEVIEKAIADYTKMSEAEIRQLFFEAGQVSDDFYEEVYSKAGMPFVPLEDNPYMQQFLSAGIEQTNNELVNFTQSMGFAVRQADGTLVFQGVAKTYQSALDLAQMQVATGVFDYTTAIRSATKSLTDSGLQFVDYASGHRNRADVAARRAILTGISQMTGKVSEQNMQELDTDIVETSAHAGARPDHAVWQGRWFSFSGKSTTYPSLVAETGYGTGAGLKGWNCRHDFYPVIPGISEPSYTEEELANIDPPPIEYNGKTLTYYECTQKQRAMETAMRKTKREIIAAEASGDEDMLTAKSILLRRQREEYAKFSKEAGLLTQNERTQVYGFGKSVAQKARWKAQKALDNGGGSGIMKSRQYDFLDGILGSNIIPEDKAKKLDETISVIPPKHLTVINNTIKKVEYVKGRGYCSYNPTTKTLILDEDVMNFSIIHEFGHVLADAYDIYNDKEFIDILTDGLDLSNGYSLLFIEANVRETKIPVYYIENNKFVDKYQGRCYINMDVLDFSKPIPHDALQEYFSVGFNTYFSDPNLLKNNDPKLYGYIERLMKNV